MGMEGDFEEGDDDMMNVYKCIHCDNEYDENELVTMPRENAPGQLRWIETACPKCGGLCLPEHDLRKVFTADELLRFREVDIETATDEDVIKLLPHGCTDCQFVDVLIGKSGVSLTCRHPKAATVCTEEFAWDVFDDIDTNHEIVFDCPLDKHFARAKIE
jgi:hypothetical protein